MEIRRPFIVIGSVLAGLAVAAGAFGAHGLRDVVSPERLDVFDTAVRYQMMHALAMLLVGVLATEPGDGLLRAAGWCFALGIVLFSGSLYALVLGGVPALGAVTPIGGVFFLAGWGLLAARGLSPRRPPRTGA
jgi:uncharacterized membrane protein YgdD (TMEM256/DUF423 family)